MLKKQTSSPMQCKFFRDAFWMCCQKKGNWSSGVCQSAFKHGGNEGAKHNMCNRRQKAWSNDLTTNMLACLLCCCCDIGSAYPPWPTNKLEGVMPSRWRWPSGLGWWESWIRGGLQTFIGISEGSCRHILHGNVVGVCLFYGIFISTDVILHTPTWIHTSIWQVFRMPAFCKALQPLLPLLIIFHYAHTRIHT